MAPITHTLILSSIINRVLSPQDIQQQGLARRWLDDRGWYSIIIDFQSRPGIVGVMLTVGVHFHWYVQDFISLDIGRIESDFIYFYNENDFRNDIEGIARIALQRVFYYREALDDFNTAEKLLTEYPFASSNLWGYYHKGIIYGLNGGSAKSKTCFEQLISSTNETPWANELKIRTRELLPIISDVLRFKHHIHNIIATSRKLKTMSEQENSSLWK